MSADWDRCTVDKYSHTDMSDTLFTEEDIDDSLKNKEAYKKIQEQKEKKPKFDDPYDGPNFTLDNVRNPEFLVKLGDSSASVKGAFSSFKESFDSMNSNDSFSFNVGVGTLTEKGVEAASKLSGSTVLVFQADVTEEARKRADQLGVEIAEYSAIYKIFEDIRYVLDLNFEEYRNQVLI